MVTGKVQSRVPSIHRVEARRGVDIVLARNGVIAYFFLFFFFSLSYWPQSVQPRCLPSDGRRMERQQALEEKQAYQIS